LAELGAVFLKPEFEFLNPAFESLNPELLLFGKDPVKTLLEV